MRHYPFCSWRAHLYSLYQMKLNVKGNQIKVRQQTSEFRTKNWMALKLFEFVELFMMDTFLLKLTQFEKTGSIGITFFSLGNLIIIFHFQN